MINPNEFTSLCIESHKKTKFGIDYVEKLYQKPSGERFAFILLKKLEYAWINNIILDFLCKCYSFYKDGAQIKITFSGYKSGIISYLIKLQKNDLIEYRSANFLLEKQQLIYPSLFLNIFNINKNKIKKSIKNKQSKYFPAFQTVHIAGNNIKVFCKAHKNNNLLLYNVKMLNQMY